MSFARRMQSPLFILLGAGIALASPCVCFAHCDPPLVLPTPVAIPGRTEWYFPLRWSWLHWWEANRDPYLDILRQRVTQEEQRDVVEAARQRSAAALRQTMSSEHWQLRATAAISLGQIGDDASLPDLLKLANADKRSEVRQAAVLGLALLGSPEAEAALGRVRQPSDAEQVTRMRGLGLFGEASPTLLRQLSRMVEKGTVASAASATWATGQLAGAGKQGLLQEVFTKANNVWLASEAALGLGLTANPQAVPLLADLLLATDRGRTLPAWQRLERTRLEKLDLAGVVKNSKVAGSSYNVLYSGYVKKERQWQDGSLHPLPLEPNTPNTGFTVRLGREEIHMGQLRGAAAIALGYIDTPASRRALIMALQQTGDEFGGQWVDVFALPRAAEFSDWHKGMAIMSLGRIADAECLEPLTATLEGRIVTAHNQGPTDMPNSPLRGYAALALGLYASPKQTPQGPVDRPQFEQVCERLARHAADPRETSEVRTACTLALGLTGRTANLKRLQPLTEVATSLDDEVQTGYSLLARAMLGDRNIIEPTRAFLQRPEVPDSTTSILARRAAVLGLGVLGSQEVIPILRDTWHLSYHVNREIVVALALCKAFSVTDDLIGMVKNAGQPWEQLFGARCLADLFMEAHPRRVGRFLRHSNYALRDNVVGAFRSLANEFLYEWLIPAFQEPWY